jgi:hypothetical protein
MKPPGAPTMLRLTLIVLPQQSPTGSSLGRIRAAEAELISGRPMIATGGAKQEDPEFFAKPFGGERLSVTWQ